MLTLTKKQIGTLDRQIVSHEWRRVPLSLGPGRKSYSQELNSLRKALERANVGHLENTKGNVVSWSEKMDAKTTWLVVPLEDRKLVMNAVVQATTAKQELEEQRKLTRSPDALVQQGKPEYRSAAGLQLLPIPVRIGSLDFMKHDSLGIGAKRSHWCSAEASAVYVDGHYVR
jgi:hypothetical protein